MGDAALEFIVTANEHVINPTGANESLEVDCLPYLFIIAKFKEAIVP